MPYLVESTLIAHDNCKTTVYIFEKNFSAFSAHECREESTQKVKGDNEDTYNVIFRIFRVTKFYYRTSYFQ